MSSLKFSYWSSPQTSTKSGLKSSRILRIARKSLPNRSPQRCAAPSPSSLPSSANNSDGQLPGSFTLGSTFGASSTRLNTSISRSFGRHRVGQCVHPSPRISAISVPPYRVRFDLKNCSRSGWVAKTSLPSGIVTQGCLLRVQKCAVVLSHEVSSSVPARTRRIISAPDAPGCGLLVSQQPHSGQTHLVTTRPLSAIFSSSRGSPFVRRNALSCTVIASEKALLVRC